MSSDQNASGDDALPDVELWLVDGYNVLHAVMLGGESRGRFWERGSRERLVTRLATGGGVPGDVVLVFDGQHPVEGDEARPAPALELVFAPSADDWIVRRVRQAECPERLGVVTQDRQVAGRARHAGAQIVSPAAFLGAFPDSTTDSAAEPAD